MRWNWMCFSTLWRQDNPEGSRFKWNVEVLWAVDSYLRETTPEKREAFIDAVRKAEEAG